MRRQNYFNNRKIRRQAKKVICIATLTATMLTSIPFVSYTDAYAKGQTTLEEMKALSIPTEDATTYNLSDASLITDKTIVDYFGRETMVKVIEINITENGNYKITGSNEINDALIDTHIVVAEGVEANIIFDGATIKNDDRYGDDVDGCGSVLYSQLFPILDIEGKANLYVEKDSSLTSAAVDNNPVICVTGEMTQQEGTGSLKLAVGSGEGVYSQEQVICGYKNGKWGNVTIKGGKLDFTGSIYNVDQFTMTGGTITSKVDEDQVIMANDINISGGVWKHKQGGDSMPSEIIGAYDSITISGGSLNLLRGKEAGSSCRAFGGDKVRIIGGTIQRDESIYIQDALDAYANKLDDSFTLENLPENANVKAINGVPAAGLTTTPEGKLENIPLPDACNIIELEKNGNIYQYKYAAKYVADTKSMVPDTETKVYDVTLKFTNEDGSTTEKTVKLADGFKIQGQYFDGVDFYECLDANDTVVTDTNPFTISESNKEVTLKKKAAVITVDGKEIEGNVVPEGSIYGILPDGGEKWTQCADLAYPGDVMKEDTRLVTIPSQKREGKWFVELGSTDEVWWVKNQIRNNSSLNVVLVDDLDLKNKKAQSLFPEYYSFYYGIFDGDGHVIKNMECKELYVLPERNYGVIKNVHFNNIRIQQPRSNTTRSGIICGNNYGTIENCSVESSVIEMLGEVQVGGPNKELCEGLNVYGALTGANFGTIRGCFASGVTFSGDGVSYPIAQDFSKSKLENVYYQAEVESGEIAKSATQFASGEVCSLLNRGVTDGSQYWYQNIDNDAEKDAVPVPDRSHGTVYSGYQGCTKAYSNTELSDTPSHEVKYTAENNVLTGVCKADPSHTVTMTLTAEDAEYDGKEHKAVLNKTYSDTWKEAATDVDAKIIYTRDGKPTTDLTSAGTIKASVTMGDAAAEVIYTIKVTPTPTPTATPMASPSAAPTATPTVSPSVVPSAGPTATPAGTNPGSVPSADPSAVPTKAPGTPATPAPSSALTPAPASEQSKQPQASESQKSEPKGSKLKKNGNKYMVTSASKKTPTIKYTGSSDKTKKKVIIPKTVTIDGVEYKVTSIGKKAFRNNKSLKEVVIGKNITKIETKAFYGCKNLRRVTFKTTTLSKKSVGKNAFGKINNKASYLIPSEKLKKYKRWLKKRGAIKQQIFRKY